MLSMLGVVGVTVELGIVMVDEEGISPIDVLLDKLFFSVVALLLAVVDDLVA